MCINIAITDQLISFTKSINGCACIRASRDLNRTVVVPLPVGIVFKELCKKSGQVYKTEERVDLRLIPNDK